MGPVDSCIEGRNENRDTKRTFGTMVKRLLPGFELGFSVLNAGALPRDHHAKGYKKS